MIVDKLDALGLTDWKLIEFFDTGQKELYNLADDISEQNDLADENLQKVAELQELLATWREDAGARIPGGQQGGAILS